MDESDDAILVCVPVAGTTLIAPGSERERCSRCGEAVWVSPASRAAIAKLGVPVPFVCIACAAPDIPSSVWMPPTVGQRIEANLPVVAPKEDP